MGKLLSFFSKTKTKSDRNKQVAVLTNISNNDNIQWNEPQQKLTITEAARAAQRLSVYEKEPQDSDERKQYFHDVKTVEDAIEVLKENYQTDNKDQIQMALEEARKQDEMNQIEPQNTYNILVTNALTEDEKQFETENAQGVKKKRKRSARMTGQETTYSGIRLQIDQCYSFKGDPWILDPERKNNEENIIKTTHIVTNIDEYHKNRRVTLSNGHNFLWFTTAIQSILDDVIDNEMALSRKELDKELDLLPIPFREKIWQMSRDIESDLMYPDDYAEFVDCLLLATGQFEIDDDMEELGFQIRDMTQVFCSIVDVDAIFGTKGNTSNWSKTARCLSTKGATEIVKAARNCNAKELEASDDMAITLFTGFTRKAIKHAMTFCTQIFWKVLTDIWWDQDDEEDMALPMSFDKYNGTGAKSKSRKATFNSKISEQQRQSICAVSLEVLFPDLVLFDENEE
eukprot:120642_1